jgi:hypothetical protein
MKTTLILTLFILLLTGSMLGQQGKLSNVDSKTENSPSHLKRSDSSRLSKSNLKEYPKLSRQNNSKHRTKLKYQDYGPMPYNQDFGPRPSVRLIKSEKHLDKQMYYAPYYNMTGTPINEPRKLNQFIP